MVSILAASVDSFDCTAAGVSSALGAGAGVWDSLRVVACHFLSPLSVAGLL